MAFVISPVADIHPIRVLIVDDSPVVRDLLARELSRDAAIKVIDAGPITSDVCTMIAAHKPDVVLLDIEMPQTNAAALLHHLMAHCPVPVIILSSPTAIGTRIGLDALAAGAVDALCKPGSTCSIEDMAPSLIQKIKAAACASVQKITRTAATVSEFPADMPEPAYDKILAIGASIGGVQALTEVLSQLPANAPGTLIVQHMPAGFTADFAKRLKQQCHMEVKEAAHGDTVLPGRVLIAPGGFHMLLRRSDARYYIEIKDGPEVCHQKPSVEVLFNSVAKAAGANAVGAILTGMGPDGAAGLLNMRKAGARTIAEDQTTCVASGTSTQAIQCGAAEHVVPLPNMAATLVGLASNQPNYRAAQ